MNVKILASVLLFASLFALGCVSPSPMPLPTNSPTATVSATATATSTPFPTATVTSTATATATSTPTPTATPTATPSPTSSVTRVSVNADDYGFYPQTVSATAGSTVELTFNVDAEDVYYGGLQIKCQALGIDTGTIQPGGTKTITFNLEEDLLCSSYWPATGVKKGNLNIDAT